jgi:hypothetical protein
MRKQLFLFLLHLQDELPESSGGMTRRDHHTCSIRLFQEAGTILLLQAYKCIGMVNRFSICRRPQPDTLN